MGRVLTVSEEGNLKKVVRWQPAPEVKYLIVRTDLSTIRCFYVFDLFELGMHARGVFSTYTPEFSVRVTAVTN